MRPASFWYRSKKGQHFLVLPFLLCLAVLAQPVHAAYSVPDLQGAMLEEWSNLGHYNSEGISEISDSRFFVSPGGKNNPTEEYLKFVDLVHSYITTRNGAELLCEFPARMTFLEKHLDWFDESSRPKCEEYEQLLKPSDLKSISLIFASGYFDNPGSYYGHTLVRFNYDSSVFNQKMLDSSLNYGADITNNEGTVLYILNGLFGGYTGSYQRNNSFIHSHRYTNGQLRDLWEYKLKLTSDQQRFIAEHGWEIRKVKFTYYFFNDNCAHRIANLIERATGLTLSDTHGFWLLPIQVVKNLKENNLIDNEGYYPSLKSAFSKRYMKLRKNERNGFISFFDAKKQEQELVAKNLSTETLFLALDHLDIQIAKLTIDKKKQDDSRASLESQRRVLLSEILERPSINSRDKVKWDKNFTLMDYKAASVVRTGYVNRSNKSAMSLHYQAANNDLLDRSMSGQEKSRFIMGSVEAEINNEDIDIRDFTIVDITNLNTNVLPMRLTNEFSWQVKIGYNSQSRVCIDCASFGITGKAGKAVRVDDNLLFYSLAGGRLNHREVDDHKYVSVLSESGVLIDVQSMGRINTGFDVILDPISEASEYIIKTDYAFDLNEAYDFRIGIENDTNGNTMFTARLGHYFN